MKKREEKQIDQLFDEWMGEFLQSNLNKPLPWEYVLECWRRRLIEEYGYVADDFLARIRLRTWILKNGKQYVLNPHLYDPETGEETLRRVVVRRQSWRRFRCVDSGVPVIRRSRVPSP